MNDAKELFEKLELHERFPGSLKARLDDRGGFDASEDSLGAFVQDVAEDSLWVDDLGRLCASDGETYTIVWHPEPRGEWVEWDQVRFEEKQPPFPRG